MKSRTPITDIGWQKKLNSLTQYPSIPTYHQIINQGKGHLSENRTATFDGPVHVTEKVDGTNARIVILPEGMWFLGGRTDWLTARGDIVYNPKNEIVVGVRDTVNRLTAMGHTGKLTVIYTECYGGETGANWTNYTGDKNTVGHRVFDVFTLNAFEFDEMMTWPIENIAGWRDAMRQPFLPFSELSEWTMVRKLDVVPFIATIDAHRLPIGVTETETWLKTLLSDTRVALDDNAKGIAEGVILRSEDRKTITKVRHEDYERTTRVHRQTLLNANSAARRSKPASPKRTLPT